MIHLSSQCFSHQTRIILKTFTFKLQLLILNLYLRNTFRSYHLIKSVDRPPCKNIFSHSGWCGALSPHTSFCISMFFPLDSTCSMELYFQTDSHVQTFCVDL